MTVTVITLAKAAGGRGNPSKVYMVEVEIDLAAAATAKGSALAAADVIGISVGANTVVMFAGAEITTAPSGGNGCTFDLGITGDVDAFVDGMTATGASAGDWYAGKHCVSILVTTADTIDMLLIGTTPDTVNSYACLMDVVVGAQAADEEPNLLA